MSETPRIDDSAVALPPAEPSPLIRYTLQGLEKLWMPQRRRYSYIYRLDGGKSGNVSIPERDTFYTLNVLLGLSRLRPIDQPAGVDIAAVYLDCCRDLTQAAIAGDQFPPYAYGMALWAGAALGIAPPGSLVDRIRGHQLADDRVALMRAQDLGLLTSGAVALAVAGEPLWRPVADRLSGIIRDKLFHPISLLFFNQQRGFRRNYSSFASQVYSILALYQYGAAFDLPAVVRVANAGAWKVMSLQGPQGEWGWFYDVPRGRVVDFYEIYSVHQHGMAPAFLHHAEAQKLRGARDSIVKGFNWLFGDNQMNVSMLYPERHLFYRSQLRHGERDTVARRGLRSIVHSITGRSDAVDRHGRLELRRECRSYELGWILWSFGGRDDYPELTHRPAFASMTKP